ncbi:MAG: hypothetical protein QOK05_783 [Chloroflexota bacterium]|nr:hypothetical protein [Chloroflexota bacterium]
MEGFAPIGWDSRRAGAAPGTFTEHLRENVGIDPVTGLDTGARFELRVAQELKRAARGGHPTAVAVFELTGWHTLDADVPEAATLLVRAAAVVTEELRDIDTVGWLRGARFAALLPMCDRASAHNAARRVTRQLTELSTLEVSAGFASTSEIAGWDLLDAAEAAMQPVATNPLIAAPSSARMKAAV